MKFKNGDRVKLRGTQHKGTVQAVTETTCRVLLDKGTTAWHGENSLIRLVKKNPMKGYFPAEIANNLKSLTAKECERMIGRIKGVAVTRQQLAKAWDKFVWGNNQIYRSADSALFDAFCKKIGFNEGER